MIRHQLLVAVFAGIALAGWSQGNEIIVESFSDGLNSQGFSSVQGKWTESTGKSTAPGVTATKSVFNDANAEAAVARFTPDLPTAGKYEVFITYPAQGNATNIKYTVLSNDGPKEIVLTQNGRDLGHTPTANQWHSLGTYNFTTGVSGYVEISDPLTGEHPLANEPNARIYADAVKFVPTSGAVTPATAAATQAPASPADMPGLPAVQAAATPAPTPEMPGLPPATAQTESVAQLPALPATTGTASAAAALPTLPGATPVIEPTPASTGMPPLPSTTPATETAQAALPDLPSTPAAATGALPDLPPAQPAPVATTPIVTAQATPYPVPDLPSLAPVTPTPQRTLPSPADTPMAGMPTGLPGGPLSNLPPTPVAPLVSGTAPGLALPTPFAAPMPGAMPTPATGATPASFGPNTSITQYNPANLQWMYDYGAALNTARAQNKKVLVFFTAAGSKAADTYETNYFVDPSVRQALDQYVLIKVDFPKNTRLGYSLGIFGAGIIVVTSPAGDVTARITQLPPTPLDLVKQMAGTQPAQGAATPATGASAAAAPATVTATLAIPTPDPAMPAMPGVAPMPETTPPAMP